MPDPVDEVLNQIEKQIEGAFTPRPSVRLVNEPKSLPTPPEAERAINRNLLVILQDIEIKQEHFALAILERLTRLEQFLGL